MMRRFTVIGAVLGIVFGLVVSATITMSIVVPVVAEAVTRWQGFHLIPKLRVNKLLIGAVTVTADGNEFNYLDITTLGATQASKALTADSSSQTDTIDLTGSLKIDGDVAIQCETVTVSTSEMLALNATPKVLIAAPGANKVIIVHSALLSLNYNSTAYDGVGAAEDLTIAYTDGSGADVLPPIETAGFIDQANDETRVVFATGTVVAGGSATAPIIPVANAAVVLSMDVGEIATGNSPLGVRICYQVLPDLL